MLLPLVATDGLPEVVPEYPAVGTDNITTPEPPLPPIDDREPPFVNPPPPLPVLAEAEFPLPPLAPAPPPPEPPAP